MTDCGNTILLHFQVGFSAVKNRNKIQTDLLQILKTYIAELSPVQCLSIGGGFLIMCTGSQGTVVTVRGFIEGLISINIEYFREKGQERIFTLSQEREMVENIAKAIGSPKYESLPLIKRGSAYMYDIRSNEQGMAEYDIDEIIFRKSSPFQRVLIAHSLSFGNMLFLDNVINHSSSDVIYTETLIQKGKEDYGNKQILILGGGDGSTLCEILKESPKYVVMVDIDEVVIRACRLHFRDVNDGVFDNMKGPNYEVIIGDCLEYLESCINNGTTFDYVFGCLTDFCSDGSEPTSNSKALSLIKTVITLSMRVLKLKGKYMGHCCGTLATDALDAFDGFLHEMDEPVEFTTDVAYVPSFVEFWQFYQIWKKNE